MRCQVAGKLFAGFLHRIGDPSQTQKTMAQFAKAIMRHLIADSGQSFSIFIALIAHRIETGRGYNGGGQFLQIFIMQRIGPIMVDVFVIGKDIGVEHFHRRAG